MDQVFTAKHWKTGQVVDITVTKGQIVSVTQSDKPANLWIAPGLIDVQLNGIGGFNLNTSDLTVEDVQQIVKLMQQGGVTRFCPTVVTGPKERMLHCIRIIAEACNADSSVNHAVIGIHVEGPFISDEDGPRGAHNKMWVRNPSEDELMEWLGAAGGKICKVTLAPEKPGALDFIRLLRQNGIVAAIGHCNASEEQIRLAVEAGATMSTHLGNGAHPYIKRHPNYIWAQLADDRLWAGLISDGHHLPASTLKVMLRAKGPKAILISDANHLAGLPPGRYTTHHADVILEPNGLLHLAHTPDILAGSATPLHRGIQFVASSGICPLEDAIQMATLHPAGLFGLDQKGVGTLDAGSPADFILYDWGEDKVFHIVQTVSNGTVVYSA
ncbi:N-acetylglucosamine-6-phosphate deacetylase [Paenibacillus filicis]|uniref:N-acetylglucosamine-6-phosphate deacetylase n=1 Tax=Paenibacillus gyeongsangnamensis TaxID=3388067 RepID=A0ABT4Q5M2_9BACL|nr:N-acetylglucosamine-6-phosphate deacetylase [Paenibacillus filicis]MCZ8512162.1 N-acetylglucosamine-6-phosphate deacetylase [Paenibacillus filicis]